MKTFITPENKYVIQIDIYKDYTEKDYFTANNQKLSPGTYTFDEEPKMQVHKERDVLYYYVDGEGNKIKVEEFCKREKELLSFRTHKYNDEYVWNSLEDEYNYRKFLITWAAFYRLEISNETYKVKWEIHRKPESEDVQTSYYTGSDKWRSYAWFDEKSVVTNLIRKLLNNNGLKELDCGLGSNQKVGTYKMFDFDKEVSIYLYKGHFGWKYGKKYATHGTLEQMEKNVKNLKKEITESLTVLLQSSEKFIATSEVITSLRGIYDDLFSLGITVKAKDNKNDLLRKVRELLENIEKQTLNKENEPKI